MSDNNIISITQIIQIISQKLGVDENRVQQFISILFDNVKRTLLNSGEVVVLKGLGSFKKIEVDEKNGLKKNKIVYKLEDELKKMINTPFAHLETITLNVPNFDDDKLYSQRISEDGQVIQKEPMAVFQNQALEIKELLSEIESIHKNQSNGIEKKEAVVSKVFSEQKNKEEVDKGESDFDIVFDFSSNPSNNDVESKKSFFDDVLLASSSILRQEEDTQPTDKETNDQPLETIKIEEDDDDILIAENEPLNLEKEANETQKEVFFDLDWDTNNADDVVTDNSKETVKEETIKEDTVSNFDLKNNEVETKKSDIIVTDAQEFESVEVNDIEEDVLSNFDSENNDIENENTNIIVTDSKGFESIEVNDIEEDDFLESNLQENKNVENSKDTVIIESEKRPPSASITEPKKVYFDYNKKYERAEYLDLSYRHISDDKKFAFPWKVIGIILGILVGLLIVFTPIILTYLGNEKKEKQTEYMLDSIKEAERVNKIKDSLERIASLKEANDLKNKELRKERKSLSIENLRRKSKENSKSIFHKKRSYNQFIATVTLTSGSRLGSLARKYYGHPKFWVYIYEANKKRISNPNDLPVGFKIKIPKLEKRLIDKNNPQCIQYAIQLEKRYLK